MLEKIKKHLVNIRGTNTDQKLVVFESDDWGTIRIPDNDSREFFLSKGWIKKNDPFSNFDALESQQDLQQITDTLLRFRDSQGKPPVITANTIVSNPDFNAIQRSNFKEYRAESFVETYKRYPQHQQSFKLFQEAIKAGVMFPQFHGREHVNVEMWMQLLQRGDQRFHEAFRRRCFAIDYSEPDNRRSNLMAAFDYHTGEGFNLVSESIKEGLTNFKNVFGIQSATAIAPCYVWNDEVEHVLAASGVQGIQSSKFQNIPHGHAFKRKLHYLGQQNSSNQVYLVRNCLFEPSLNETIDWVQKCLESIRIAFLWKKPAIIGTHRLNYIGYLQPENREKNLQKLKNLLTEILKQWPDVKFSTSADVAEYFQRRNVN